jgi:hypothetical protein
MEGDFRHCFAENIDVYECGGKSSLDSLKNLHDGLQRVEDESGSEVIIATITINYINYQRYVAVAHVLGELV